MSPWHSLLLGLMIGFIIGSRVAQALIKDD